MLLALLCAYFLNIPRQTSLSHHYRTGRAASAEAVPSNQFDSVVYNIAKALLAYIVYAQHVSPWCMFKHSTIVIVKESVLGGYQGIIAGAATAGIMGFYEAILKKK